MESRFHVFPPLPYLLMAGTTALARTSPTPEGVLGLARAYSALMAIMAVVGAGIAVRNLQQRGSWLDRAGGHATIGLALMPGLALNGCQRHRQYVGPRGRGAELRGNYHLGGATQLVGSVPPLAVIGVAAFAVAATRQSAYPALMLLMPLAMLVSRGSLRITKASVD